MDEQLVERARMDALYKAIFEDDRRGAAVLEDLARHFAKGPARGFTQDAVTETFVRAHQRKVFDFIMTRINRASGAEDQPPDQGNDDDLQLLVKLLMN